MGKGSWWRAVGLVVLGCLIVAGCRKQSEVEKAKAPRRKIQVVTPKDVPDAVATPGKEETKPAAPVKVPDVVLTAQDRAMCVVYVGDRMPEGELPDLAGKRQPLKSLLGKRATVVLFWTGDNPYAAKALEDLELDVAQSLAGKGAAVIGVAVRQSPEAARKALADAGAKYPNLLDADGAYFAKVARDRLPRVYVLDAEGKVLWLDIEYSSTTQRQLLTALGVVLEAKS